MPEAVCERNSVCLEEMQMIVEESYVAGWCSDGRDQA